MNNYPIRNLPLIGTIIINERDQTPSNLEQAAVKKLFYSLSKELENKDQVLQQFDSFSTELIRMGYDAKIVLRSFLVHKYTTLEEAIEVLGKTEDLWNHKFIECYEDRCFICNEDEDQHRTIKNILIKKSLSNGQTNLNEEKIKSLLRQTSKSEVSRVEVEQGQQGQQCQICLNDITSKTFYLRCLHKFCQECIEYYLEEEIKNSRVKQIKCPQKECNEIFPEDTIPHLLTKESYERYIKFKERMRLKEDDNLLSCPVSDCEGFASKLIGQEDTDNHILIEIDNPEKKLLANDSWVEHVKIRYTCNKGHNFCGRCRRIWHDDQCNQDVEIKNFSTSTGNIVKKCPSCKIWIEKNEGCNHMMCSVCKCEWCWLCEQKYTAEHYNTVGTPCYNRQFNENQDPEVQRIMEFQQQNQMLFNIFFVFMYTILVIKLFSRSALRNNENRERNSKVALYVTFFVLTGLVWFISMLFNGFIFITMLNSLTKMAESRNNCAKFMCILTYIPLFFALYFPNILLSTIWFVFSNVASCFILSAA